MKRQEATNTFQEGMVMDFNPLTTPNNVVTNCLNGTLITFNGNEYVLQNDMGNGRVETAYLPEGYVPLGTTELGGIIYIVSYNPLINQCQIGSFPSPERNITSDELNSSNNSLNFNAFYESNSLNLKTTSIKLLLTSDFDLNPGDKYKIYTQGLNSLVSSDCLSGVTTKQNINVNPRWVKLHIAAIQDDGKIVYLDDNLVWNETLKQKDDYYIKDINLSEVTKTPDEYRSLTVPEYCVFNTNSKGKLAIIAELEVISTFDCSLSFKKEGQLLTIVSSVNWTYNNPIKESQSSINLKKIQFNIGNSSQEISISNTENRLNDGSDPNVELDAIIKTVENDILHIEVTPGMEFGYMPWLKHSFSVNVNKLGTGETSLNEYRYFIDTDSVTINWGLDAYPEEGKTIDSVNFYYKELDEVVYNKLKTQNTIKLNFDPSVSDYDSPIWEGDSKWDTLFETKKSSYLGHFMNSLTLDSLEKNKCYVLAIEINYAEQSRYYYRILYTLPIFNDDYYKETDFNNLELNDNNLKIGYTYKETQNSSTATSVLQKDGVPQIDNKLDSAYEELTETFYNVHSSFDNDYSMELSFKSKYEPVFKVSCTNAEKDTINITNSNNARVYKIADITDELPPIKDSVEFDPSSVIFEKQDNTLIVKNIKWTSISDAPMKGIYNDTQPINIEYQLEPLKVGRAYLVSETAEKGLDLYCQKNFIRDEGAMIHIGDHSRITTSINTCESISDGILSNLADNDILIIVFTNGSSKKGVDCGIYYDNGSTFVRQTNRPDWNDSNVDRLALLLYVVKTQYGFYCFYSENPKVIKLSQFDAIINDKSEKLAQYYRKPAPYSGRNKDKFFIKDQFVSWYNYDLTDSIKVVLKNMVKNVTISGFNPVEDIPNLKYTQSDTNVTLQFTIINKVDMNQYNRQVNQITQESFVIYQEGDKEELLPIELGSHDIFQINKDSSGNIQIIPSSDSKFIFFKNSNIDCTYNEQLTIKAFPKGTKTIGVFGEDGDQSLKLSDLGFNKEPWTT